MWIKSFFILCVSLNQYTLAAKMRCYYDSFTNYTEAGLDNPGPLFTGTPPCIDPAKCCTVFSAFGFNHDVDNGPAITTLMPTYIAQGECNVILLNWEKEASDLGLGIGLGYLLNALPNSKIIGKKFGQTLKKMRSKGLCDYIHLLGHSLGAQLMGYAGREDGNITLLTALDPAGAGYNPPSLYHHVDQSSANFVIGIHSDPGGYAMNISVGHVDFWPNDGAFVGGSRLQPGCNESDSDVDKATNGNRCSHDFCWRIFNASLAFEHIFVGAKASNYSEFVKENGSSTDTNYIGPAVNKTKRGNYYLTTNAGYPFGRGEEGLKP